MYGDCLVGFGGHICTYIPVYSTRTFEQHSAVSFLVPLKSIGSMKNNLVIKYEGKESEDQPARKDT